MCWLISCLLLFILFFFLLFILWVFLFFYFSSTKPHNVGTANVNHRESRERRVFVLFLWKLIFFCFLQTPYSTSMDRWLHQFERCSFKKITKSFVRNLSTSSMICDYILHCFLIFFFAPSFALFYIVRTNR